MLIFLSLGSRPGQCGGMAAYLIGLGYPMMLWGSLMWMLLCDGAIWGAIWGLSSGGEGGCVREFEVFPGL